VVAIDWLCGASLKSRADLAIIRAAVDGADDKLKLLFGQAVDCESWGHCFG
jgi:hypothetical protein